MRIKSALFFISLLVRSSLRFESTYHPALNVNVEGRSFNSSPLKTRQTPKEKVNGSILAAPGRGGRRTCASKHRLGTAGTHLQHPTDLGSLPTLCPSPRTVFISEHTGPRRGRRYPSKPRRFRVLRQSPSCPLTPHAEQGDLWLLKKGLFLCLLHIPQI